MTSKVYKTAQGKAIDLGALLLQNEGTRAVGNMNVNARGDLVDGNNQVIDQKNKQVQRQYKRQTNVSDAAKKFSSTVDAKKHATTSAPVVDLSELDSISLPDSDVPAVAEDPTAPVTSAEIEQSDSSTVAKGGLAAAIARSREIKQELEKTVRQREQESGIRKI
jgi:hypothetical protein